MQLKSTSEIGNNVRWIIVDEGMLISSGEKKQKRKKEKKRKNMYPAFNHATNRWPWNEIYAP